MEARSIQMLLAAAGGEIMKVGLIGAGRMGRPMAERLAAAGHAVSLFARTMPFGASLGGSSIEYAATMAQTVADADAVFIVVLRDDRVRAVCLGPEGALANMKAGGTLV